LSENNAILIQQLQETVGRGHVLTSAQSTERYRTGFRSGGGLVLAVIRPGSLVEQWRVLNLCIAAGKIIIMQAANTGLTGGSTPDGSDYDREVVIISTLRMATAHLINDGRQVICLPGATLFQLEKMLRPLGREPHSVIGSSCIGASVFGGVCNNSGGALIRRGPAFTQMALFAQVDAQRQVQLVNHLGVRLGNDPETILTKLEAGDFGPTDIEQDHTLAASDHGYAQYVRDIDSATPARFNADPQRLFEASGSAGKIMLFAVRLDTFEMEAQSAVFYIGTNDVAELTALRRHMLGEFSSLPIAAEYMHRDAFNIAEKYGKDMFLAIQYLGTDRLPGLFAMKARFDTFIRRLKFLPKDMSDRLMQFAGKLFPAHLPPRLRAYRDQFEHHLMLKVSGDGIAQARDYLSRIFPSASGAFFECTPEEGKKAFLHRFATAGAAIRYRVVHHQEVEDIVALDIALARNERAWFETLPAALDEKILHKLYYGHFFCHVFHQDYIVRKGVDTLALEHEMLKILDGRGAQYPAEHNVGHLYAAKPALVKHYKALDPCNCFNPGIGHTSKLECWG
jgi:D-lactate dehydrogenase